MQQSKRSAIQRHRRAAATVELAILLPFLFFLFVVAVDYARIFYFGVTLENCARNGAYYASNYPNNNNLYNDIYGYGSLDEAILKDASNLYDSSDSSTKPTYTIAYSSSSSGPFNLTTPPTYGTVYVQVTVNWTFRSLTHYPGVPSQVNLSRKVAMRMAPAQPEFD